MTTFRNMHNLSACLHKVSGAKHKRGFTLLETIIAVGLLSLVLIGAFALLVGSYATMRRAQEDFYVTRLLETAVEMTRNLSWADINGDASIGVAGFASSSPLGFSTASTLLMGTNANVLFNKGYSQVKDPQAEMTLQNSSGKIYFNKLNDNLYKVTVTVSYTPYRLGPVNKSTTTYIARKGINRRS